MRIWFLMCIVFLAACSTSRKGQTDYTVNRSRSASQPKRATSSAETSKLDRTKNQIASESVREDPARVEPDTDIGSSDELLVAGILHQAEGLIGTSYRYGGTSPDRGFDCSGFTSYVFASQSIRLPRTSTDQSQFGKKKKFDDAEVGDLVFFGTGSRVNHVGLVVDKSRSEMVVIHSTSSGGVRRDEINASTYWRSRKLWAISVIND